MSVYELKYKNRCFIIKVAQNVNDVNNQNKKIKRIDFVRKIILSFDDGGRDFYRVVYPTLKKYNLTGVANIISQYIKPEAECEEGHRYMSVENLVELQQNGIEIACHGRNHENTIEDILNNIEDFKNMGLDVENIGFASPGSGITMDNVHTIDSLVKDKTISYIRSAYTPDKDGKFIEFMNRLMEKSGSSELFCLMNKRNFIKSFDYSWFPSVVITSYTTMKQVKKLLKKMPDNSSVIIMFHHIYEKDDAGYGKSIWYWDAGLFRELCEYISSNENFVCVNNVDLVKK